MATKQHTSSKKIFSGSILKIKISKPLVGYLKLTNHNLQPKVYY